MRKLTINADDFGADPNINKAIAHCFKKKIINSTTILVNTKGFEEAVGLAHKNNFVDKIGLHLNLTWNKPITDLSNTGLIDEDGLFIKKSLSNPALFFSTFVKNKIANEINHQYRKLIEVGIHPTHFDSHHHIHTKPWLAPLFIHFAKKRRLKIRLAEQRIRKNIVLLSYYHYLNAVYKKNGIHFSDRFEKLSRFRKNCVKWTYNSLDYEIMVHPVCKNGVILDSIEKVDLEKVLHKFEEEL
jgi:predicted glycoside hydrolase/deacetylase ChbG (UPF0249 family)